MSLGWVGAGGFAALFTAINAPSHPGGGFTFRGVVGNGGRLAARGMCFFLREGLGWKAAWERGFWVLPVASREWRGGKRDWHVSRIPFCLGTQNDIWKPGIWWGVACKHSR